MRGTDINRLFATLGLCLTPTLISAQEAVVVNQPNPNKEVVPYVTDVSKHAKTDVSELITLLRQKVKYVFVLYQENRAFDAMFGTFPGVNGLFSQPPAETPGFTHTSWIPTEVTSQSSRSGSTPNGSHGIWTTSAMLTLRWLKR